MAFWDKVFTKKISLPDEESYKQAPREEVSGMRPVRKPGELQDLNTVEAFEEQGFEEGVSVYATLEKKIGRKPSEKNDDNILLDRKTGLIGVFDGLGSTKGEFASRQAEAAFPEAFTKAQIKMEKTPAAEIIKALVKGKLDRQVRVHGAPYVGKNQELMNATQDAAERLYNRDQALARKAAALVGSFSLVEQRLEEMREKYSEHNNGEKIEALTTACIGFIHTSPDGARWGVVANAGDSGAAIRHADGNLEMATEEDGLFAEAMEAGGISDSVLAQMKEKKSKGFAIQHGGKTSMISYYDAKVSVTSTLGEGKPEPSLRIIRLKPGDELIFGTDGLWDKFENEFTDQTDLETISKTLGITQNPLENLNALRDDASLRETSYKKTDDIAIVIAKVD